MKKRLKRYIILLVFISITVFITYSISVSFESALSNYTQTEVANYLNEKINECVIELLKNKNIKYDQLSNIHIDKNGNISSIEINTVELNMIKSELTLAVLNKMSNSYSAKMGIPLGNVIGSRFFSGRGKRIAIRIIPLGTVSGTTSNEFVSAGINQTIHRIVLNITAAANVAAPFADSSLQLNTNICIVETVIIGKIPDTYINMKG